MAVVLLAGCGLLPEPHDEFEPDSASAAFPDLDAGTHVSPPLYAGTNAKVPPVTAPPNPVTFACDKNLAAEPAQLRRLTMTQYRNTMRDLTHWALTDSADAASVITAIGLEHLPTDRRERTTEEPHGNYRRLDQAVDQTHVDETFRVASALGSALTEPARIGEFVGLCATNSPAGNEDGSDERCLVNFIQTFGARALRRTLDREDEAFYRAVYGNDPAVDPARYADLVAVMVSTPDFLYFVEHGETEVPDRPGTYTLSPYELASRLSYHFWQTLPDNALWAAAQDGSLLDPEVLKGQVKRLVADPRTQATIAELYEDLFDLEGLPPLSQLARDPKFTGFAGKDLPDAELRQHIVEDAQAMLTYYTWTVPGGINELLTSPLSFAQHSDLAGIYGVQPWDGTSDPPHFPSEQRPGLLTRAWFLVSGTANTRPIQRGVFLRRKLLCDNLAPPPADSSALLSQLRSDGTTLTTRQAVEKLTEQPGTSCAGCHAGAINPLGFAFEGFDALGRARSEQRQFDDDGTEMVALPIDTHTVPRVTPRDATVSSGPWDLVELMLQSGKIEACLARHYFRFTWGRHEDVRRDGCALERMRARLADSGRLQDMIEEVALLPELRTRAFEVPP